jgi:hypothetical protein
VDVSVVVKCGTRKSETPGYRMPVFFKLWICRFLRESQEVMKAEKDGCPRIGGVIDGSRKMSFLRDKGETRLRV